MIMGCTLNAFISVRYPWIADYPGRTSPAAGGRPDHTLGGFKAIEGISGTLAPSDLEIGADVPAVERRLRGGRICA
jgi:hypothetical protein